MPGSLFAALASYGRQTAGAKSVPRPPRSSGAGTAPGKSAQAGRGAVNPQPVSDAASSVFQFEDTVGTGVTRPYLLSTDGDYVALDWSQTTTVTGTPTANVDVLAAITQITILAQDGPIFTVVPDTDFYDLTHRFSELHIRPTVVTVPELAGGSATSSMEILGISLPKSRGPYSLLIQSAASNPYTGATGMSTSYSVSLRLGKAANRSRFVYTGLPFTPSANGVNDLAIVAPIQDVPLEELFVSGLTSNTADINYIQISAANQVIAPRILASTLVSVLTSEMETALPSTELFPLLSLKTTLTFSRGSHFYVNWGASPSSAIRLGFYWLD